MKLTGAISDIFITIHLSAEKICVSVGRQENHVGLLQQTV